MGTANALHTHGTGVDGGTDARTARHAQGGLLAVQGPTALDIRTGVLHGPGSTALVTGTSDTAPMTVSIAPHVPVSSRGVANGPYLGPALEAATKVNIAAAPAAGAGDRVDVVYFKQQDKTAGVPTPDTVYAPLYGVKQGTPGLGKPDLSTVVGAVELATVTVSPGATATNGANVVIANTGKQTVARGAAIPVSSKAERDALEKFIGLSVKRLDDGGREERYTGTGDIWASPGDVPVLASIAARNAYFTGNLRPGASALVADNLHVYSGTKWCFTLSGVATGTTDVNGVLAIAHGAGQTPTSVHFTAKESGDTVNLRVKWVDQGPDSTNLQARAVRTDTSAYWASAAMSVNWMAKF